MQSPKMKLSRLWKKDVFFEEKDVTQNIFSTRCIFMIMLFYTFVVGLNFAGIFIVDQTIFMRGYLASLVLVAVYFLILLKVGLESSWMKYINITVVAILVTIAGATLTYHTIVVIMIPIIMSSMYTTKGLSGYAFILTIISIIVSTYIGYFYGVCDANMVLLTATSLDKLSKDGVFLLNKVNENPGVTLALYYVLPRSFLATAFYLVCRNVYKMLERSMERAVQMKHLASVDDMTGLYNKNKLLEVVQNNMLAENQMVVIYWDVNRLKYVNDTYGHMAGDLLIAKVAETIKKVSDAKSVAYRYGGDEFIMLMKDGTEEKARNVIQKWQKELDAISEGCEFPVSAAAGYAAGSGAELEALIGIADEKMYANKVQHRE